MAGAAVPRASVRAALPELKLMGVNQTFTDTAGSSQAAMCTSRIKAGRAAGAVVKLRAGDTDVVGLRVVRDVRAVRHCGPAVESVSDPRHASFAVDKRSQQGINIEFVE